MLLPPSCPLTRRTLLQGVGALVTLPWLESLARGVESAPRPPKRWALLLFANGVSAPDWHARGAGDAMELSRTLAPLEPHKHDVLFLHGLRLFDRTFGPHWPFFTNFLSGQELKAETVPNVAESLDQRLARTIGRQTPLASLHLGIEPVVPGLRTGVPGVYYSTVSWSSRNTPVTPEVYPRAAFDRLFDTTAALQDQSVLDVVLDQARGLRPKLGQADRHKLDGYLESVRELERRIALADTPQTSGWRPTLTAPNLPRPEAEPPADTREHMRQMLDLLVLALQTDRTRVATMIFQNDATRLSFGFLDGVSNTPMHALSHYRNAEMREEYRRTNQYHVEQLAYVLAKLRQIDEGGVTLLDNTLLLFGSNMMDGNRHDATTLPLILCGRGGGCVRPGRVLDYTQRADAERRLCNLYLAMANSLGLPDRQFGNSIAPLTELA